MKEKSWDRLTVAVEEQESGACKLLFIIAIMLIAIAYMPYALFLEEE